MKKILFFLTLSGILVSCGNDDAPAENANLQPTSCLPDFLTGDVLAFYSFANGSVDDFSGNARHLQNPYQATATADRSGNAQCALEFNGTANTFLQFADPAFLNDLTQLTLSLWVKAGDQIAGNYEGIVQRGLTVGCPDRRGEWSLGLYDCNVAVAGFTNSLWARPAEMDDCEEFTVTTSHTWTHIVAYYSFADYQMKIYRNGQLIDSTTLRANCAQQFTPQNAGDLLIGYQFTGALDDVMLINRELIPTEVNALYQLGNCCTADE